MAEQREESYITCPDCGREVPATFYCIYCGVKLPLKPEEVEKTPKPAPPKAPPPSLPTPPPRPVEVKEDIQELMDDVSLQYTRKIALLDLLRSREVSERVFMKLYDEYTDKLQDTLNARARMVEEIRSELDEKERRYEEIRTLLEELEVRQKIGEITLEEFTEKSEGLQSEDRDLEDTVKGLRENLNYLEKMFADKAPKEVLDLETKTRECKEDLKRLLEEGTLSSEAFEKIKPDMESLIKLLNSRVKDRKERERTLQEELETLETSYRVGEISIEHYEKRRRELEGELEEVWA